MMDATNNIPFFNAGGAVFDGMKCVGISAKPRNGGEALTLTFRAMASDWLRSTLFSEIGKLKNAAMAYTRNVNLTFVPPAANSHTLVGEAAFKVVDCGMDAALEITLKAHSYFGQENGPVGLIEVGGWIADDGPGVIILTPRRSDDELGLCDVAEPVTVHARGCDPVVRMAKPGEIAGMVKVPRQAAIDDDPEDFVGSAEARHA